MRFRFIATILIASGGLSSGLCVARAGAANVHAPPHFEDARSNVLDWVAALMVDDPRVLREIAGLWTKPAQPLSADDLLDRTIRSFALADPETGRFVRQCRLDQLSPAPPELTLLDGPRATEFFAANLRLFYGCYLAQRRMYDEALEQFTDVDPADVIDPASCLFYRAVCQHQLLHTEEGLASIQALLGNTQGVPVSYSSVARLMQYELEAFRRESLEEARHLMSDVARRLDLGRGGHRVRKRENEIVATLDKLIKRMEEQQSGAGGQGGNQNAPGGGAADSSVKGATAPGEVDGRKNTGTGDWGLLDPRERTRARQLIQYDFPPHYRRAVERYFRKLAAGRAGPER